jgi:hypothetical protein
LPKINLFMAFFSRNHIGDKSPILKLCFNVISNVAFKNYFLLNAEW